MTTFKLIYTATGDNVTDRNGFEYEFQNKEEAEKAALDFSLAEHEKNPDHVDEDGKVFLMDWLGYNKPYYGNESKFVQFITVTEEEIEEEEEND